jgi:hypothetical protein
MYLIIILVDSTSIHRWWKHIYGNIGLRYVRDRVVESYTWAYVIFYERCFEIPRIIIAKMMLIITILDDTYDTHATIEECRKLHEAIQRFRTILFICGYQYVNIYAEQNSF